MAEIKRCFQTSPVSLPVFIYLGFDRYGWIPVPTELNVDTFEKVYTDISDEEKKIFKNAFVKDSNAVPCLYRLKQVENGPEWRETEKKLRAIFEKFGELSEQLTSMTEQEVNYALDLDDTRVIAITKSSSKTGRKQSVTLECDRKLKKQLNLRQNVAKRVGKNHIELDQSIKNDEDYKKYVGEKIMEKLTAPLDRLKAKRQRETTIFQDEVVHQMRFAADREKMFIGRVNLVKTVSFQVKLNPPPKNVFIFYGASGSGKSSFLSKLACVLQSKHDFLPIIRFCGTTKITSQKDALIYSIISQIEIAFK